MSKKVVIIIVVLLIVISGGVSGYFILNSRKAFFDNNALTNSQSQTQVKGDLTYTDDSGFSFNYPTGVKVSDITPNDDTYYTLLNLSKGSEKITITAKDTMAKTVDEWISGDEAYVGATLVGATNLGGISAKQYSLGQRLLTVGIDQGVLYLLEGPKDSGFWEDTQNVVASSLTFAGTPNANSASSSQDNTIYEQDEVIQ